MLIGMGGGSLSKELYDWFGYTPSTATAYAITDVLWTPAFVMRKKGSYRKNKLFCLLAVAVLRFVQSYLNDIAHRGSISCFRFVQFSGPKTFSGQTRKMILPTI